MSEFMLGLMLYMDDRRDDRFFRFRCRRRLERKRILQLERLMSSSASTLLALIMMRFDSRTATPSEMNSTSGPDASGPIVAFIAY